MLRIERGEQQHRCKEVEETGFGVHERFFFCGS